MVESSTRRTYLSALGIVGSAVLAGCRGDSPSTPSGSSPATETPTGPLPVASFWFDYDSDSRLLLVTHDGGDSMPAGDITVTGPGDTATWAELADRDATEQVEPGDIVQLGSGNAYNRSVAPDETVTLYYTGGDEREQLAQWRGS